MAPSKLRRFALFASLFSALAALVYQSLWLRGFGLAFGGTTSSISLVLAVFMAGLALGSALARRLTPKQPLKAYALAELGMGLCAVAAQILLKWVPVTLSAIHFGSGSLPASLDFLLKAFLAAVLVLPAAICSGLTLPLLMDALERGGEAEHPSFGRLYAWNTLGAAVGSLAAVFWLIPNFGVIGSSMAASLLNIGLAAVAWRWTPLGERAPVAEAASARVSLRFTLIAASSGCMALILEVVWTRSLALMLGSSVYAFALMLCATLLGIALGGALYAAFQERIKRPASALALGFAMLAPLIWLGTYTIGRLPEAYFEFMRRVAPSFGAYQAFGFLLALASLLPVSVAMGFLFPLLLRLSQGEGARRDSASLYLYNTLGCVAGALLAGFVLIPRLGIQPNYSLAAGLALLAAATALPRPSSWRWAAAGGGALLALLGAAYYRPWHKLVVTSGVFQSGISLASQTPAGVSFRDTLMKDLGLDFYEEGAEAVVAVRSTPRESERSLVINGKVDASLHGDLITQTLLAHIPLCLKPDAKNALVIGWGSGCTVGSAAAHPLRQIDCVEIEPMVPRTAPLFKEINSHKWAPEDASLKAIWEDPRVTIRYADARQDLLRRNELYDVIISEPSNPWITGVSNLFTLDFYRLARKRLSPGGVFCQWFHFYSMSMDDVRQQLRTFSSVFPKTSLWIAPEKPGARGVSGDVIILGSEQEPDLESPEVLRRLEDPVVARDLLKADCCGDGENPALPINRDRWWFYSLRLLGDADIRRLAGEGPFNTDERPRLEFSAPRNLYRSTSAHINANVEVFHGLEAASSEVIPPVQGAPRGKILGLIGGHYAQRNLFKKAVRALEEAQLAGQRGPELDLNLGYAYFFIGRGADAERHFLRAFPALPAEYINFMKQGGMFLKAKHFESALKIFEFAVKADPRNADAHFGMGVSLVQMGRQREGIEQIKESLRIRPGFVPALRALDELKKRGYGQ